MASRCAYQVFQVICLIAVSYAVGAAGQGPRASPEAPGPVLAPAPAPKAPGPALAPAPAPGAIPEAPGNLLAPEAAPPALPAPSMEPPASAPTPSTPAPHAPEAAPPVIPAPLVPSPPAPSSPGPTTAASTSPVPTTSAPTNRASPTGQAASAYASAIAAIEAQHSSPAATPPGRRLLQDQIAASPCAPPAALGPVLAPAAAPAAPGPVLAPAAAPKAAPEAPNHVLAPNAAPPAIPAPEPQTPAPVAAPTTQASPAPAPFAEAFPAPAPSTPVSTVAAPNIPAPTTPAPTTQTPPTASNGQAALAYASAVAAFEAQRSSPVATPSGRRLLQSLAAAGPCAAPEAPGPVLAPATAPEAAPLATPAPEPKTPAPAPASTTPAPPVPAPTTQASPLPTPSTAASPAPTPSIPAPTPAATTTPAPIPTTPAPTPEGTTMPAPIPTTEAHASAGDGQAASAYSYASATGAIESQHSSPAATPSGRRLLQDLTAASPRASPEAPGPILAPAAAPEAAPEAPGQVLAPEAAPPARPAPEPKAPAPAPASTITSPTTAAPTPAAPTTLAPSPTPAATPGLTTEAPPNSNDLAGKAGLAYASAVAAIEAQQREGNGSPVATPSGRRLLQYLAAAGPSVAPGAPGNVLAPEAAPPSIPAPEPQSPVPVPAPAAQASPAPAPTTPVSPAPAPAAGASPAPAATTPAMPSEPQSASASAFASAIAATESQRKATTANAAAAPSTNPGRRLLQSYPIDAPLPSSHGPTATAPAAAPPPPTQVLAPEAAPPGVSAPTAETPAPAATPTTPASPTAPETPFASAFAYASAQAATEGQHKGTVSPAAAPSNLLHSQSIESPAPEQSPAAGSACSPAQPEPQVAIQVTDLAKYERFMNDTQAKFEPPQSELPVRQLGLNAPPHVSGIVYRYGRRFMVQPTGQPGAPPQAFYFSGTNMYYAMLRQYTDPWITNAFQVFRAAGVKVVRVFAFAKFPSTPLTTIPERPPTPITIDVLAASVQEQGSFNTVAPPVNGQGTTYATPYPLQPTIGTFVEETWWRMDLLLALANANGVRLIMTLSNYEAENGGWQWYVDNVLGTGLDRELFLTNTAVKAAFKEFVELAVNRTNTITGVPYIQDQAIFSWELANEPHTDDGYEQALGIPPGMLLYNWTAEMSTFIKSLDPNHMVSIGEEGYRADGRTDQGNAWINDGLKGSDYTSNIYLPNVDFATIHVYPSNWGSVPYSIMNSQFIADRASIARLALKPIVLEEYGADFTFTPGKEVMLKTMHDGANANDVAGTIVWSAYPNVLDDTSGYNFNLTEPGSVQWQIQINYQNTRNQGSGPSSINYIPCPCSDIGRSDLKMTCGQQAAAGMCSQAWMAAGNATLPEGFCQISCGRCQCECPPCPDIPPSPQYTCYQQAILWGKCGESWMQNYCMQSCGRCPVCPCTDVPPPLPDGSFTTCHDQAALGRCRAMEVPSPGRPEGYCQTTCGQCQTYFNDCNNVSPNPSVPCPTTVNSTFCNDPAMIATNTTTPYGFCARVCGKC